PAFYWIRGLSASAGGGDGWNCGAVRPAPCSCVLACGLSESSLRIDAINTWCARKPMIQHLLPSLRSALYALRGGFLVRPLVIALTLGAAGAILSEAEESLPDVRALIPETLFPSQADPQVAQAILTVIATSSMTVVSIVFAILLMTLTLASTQFSPRILVSFVRDHVTQWTLGVFLGTFSYCIAALPAARLLPKPFAPILTVAGAMLLAPV